MVDFHLAYQGIPKIRPPKFNRGVIHNPTAEDEREIFDEFVTYDNQDEPFSSRSSFIRQTELLHCSRPGQLGRDSHILLPARVYGYVLLSRSWRM